MHALSLPRQSPVVAGGLVLVFAAVIALMPAANALLVVGGAFGLLALLAWPQLALALLPVAIPFGSLVPLPFGGANLTAADGLLVLALVLWLIRQVRARAIRVRWGALAIPFALFLLAIGSSVTGALSLQASIKELVKWGEMWLAYWLVIQSNWGFETRNFERALLAMIFLAGAAEAAVGIYQYYFQVGPEGFLINGAGRAFGTFEQPNPFAGYLGLIIPLAFGTILGSITLGRKSFAPVNLALTALALGALVAMLAALYFSLSRGAWLGVAAALGVVWVVRSRRAALVGLAVAGLLAVVVLLGQMNIIPDVVTARFSGVEDYLGLQDVRGVKVTDANFAIVERMAHWQAGLDMFQDHPWLGVGIGNYAAVYPAYSLPHWDDPLGHAHNYYINISAESGVVGLTTYLILWAAALWYAWRTVRRTTGFRQGVAAGALGVLVALSVHNLFDDLFVHSMQIQVGLTLGLIELTGDRSPAPALADQERKGETR